MRGIGEILDKDFFKAVEILGGAKGKIVVSGIGKSGHIGIKIASTFTSLGVPAVYLNSAEAMHGDLGLVNPEDAMIAISASGETKELTKVINHAKKHIKLPVVAITGNPKSSLSKISDVSLIFKVKDEGSPFNIAPMASAVASLVIGDLLATALSVKKGFGKDNFKDFHPGGALGLKLSKVSELMVKKDRTPIVRDRVSFYRAVEEINNKKLGITAVIDGKGKLIGAVSDGDVRRFLLTGKPVDKAKAIDAMTKNPKTIGKDDSLEAALSIMEKYKITSLFAIDKSKKPIGVIHMHHIIESKLT